VLFLLLYAYWPADISHKPFASLTLSDVFGTVAAGGVGVALIRALFEPSDDGIKDAWGWLGVLIAGLAVVAMFYFSPRAWRKYWGPDADLCVLRRDRPLRR
jgi:hypothetical protein